MLVTAPANPVYAVILNSPNADPPENRVAPTGLLAGSGWQFQGKWRAFLGTPVAPQFFITAKHVGGKVGDTFEFDGVSYTTVKRIESPDSDLILWQVSETFPCYAPLYDKSDEVGKPLVVFGRGTERGQPVTAADSIPPGSDLRGWRWGAGRGVLRWGTNVVTAIADGGKTTGPLLAAAFDASAGKYEAHLSAGDSGGAVFIQDGEMWKLAGINYSVDDFRRAGDEKQFNAALFDRGGFYSKTDHSPEWTFTPDQVTDAPSHFYATRISAHLEWIQRMMGLP